MEQVILAIILRGISTQPGFATLTIVALLSHPPEDFVRFERRTCFSSSLAMDYENVSHAGQ